MKLTWQGTLTIQTSRGEMKSVFTWPALTYEEAEALADKWIEQYLPVRGTKNVAINAQGQGAKLTGQLTGARAERLP